MYETLRRSGAIDAMAGQLGIAPADATSAVQALLPGLLAGFRQRVEQAGGGVEGLRDLVDMLDVLGGSGMALNVLAPEPTQLRKGEAVLVQMFGARDAGRSLVDELAESSAFDSGVLHQLLAILAMAIGGYLAARLRSAELLAGQDLTLDDLFDPVER